MLSFIIASPLFAENIATDLSPKKESAVHALLQLEIIDVSEKWLGKRKAIAIEFSQQLVAEKNYDSFVTVTENGIALDGHWVQSKDLKYLYFSNIKPNNKYEIFVRPGLESKNKLKLLAPKHFSLHSQAITPSIKFLNKKQTYSIEHFSGIKLQSVGTLNQRVSIYRLDENEVLKMANKLQEMPDLSTWSLSTIDALFTLEQQKTIVHSQSDRLKANDIINLDKGNQAGFYLILVTAKTVDGNELKSRSYFSLADFDVNVKSLNNRVEVLSYSNTKAELLADTSLQLITKDKLHKGKTDEAGYKVFSGEKAQWLIAEHSNQFVLKRIPLRKLSYSKLPTELAKVFLKKKIYQLGSQLEFSILLRDVNNQAVSDQILRVDLLDSDKNIIKTQTMLTSDLGVASSIFQLPEMPVVDNEDTSKIHTWFIRVSHNDGNGNSQITSEKIYTSAINYPDANVELISDTSIFYKGDKVKFKIKGDFGKGNDASNSVVKMKQNITWEQFASERYKDFSFGIPFDKTLQGKSVIKKVQLDEAGQAEFILPKIKNIINSVLSVQVQGDLQIEDSSIASDSKLLTYWPEKEIIGVRSLTWGSEDIALGITFEIINVDSMDALHAVENLDVKVYKENADWVYSDEQGWFKKENTSKEAIEEKTLSLLSDDVGSLDLALDAGNYRMEIRNPETDLLTVYLFSLGRSVDSDLPPDQLKLSLNKLAYKPDDTLLLSIESVYSGVANIRLESENASYDIGKLDLVRGENKLKISLDKLKNDKSFPKHFLEQGLRLYATAFYQYDGQVFSSKGKITLPIQKKNKVLVVSLVNNKNTAILHSDEYKNISAVLVLRKINATSINGMDSDKKDQIMQTTIFDENGDAILNNKEAKLLKDYNYQASLYFANELVDKVNISFAETP